jgi:hypothetical protein
VNLSVVRELPRHLAKQFLAENRDDLRLFCGQVFFPVVVDVDGRSTTRIQESIPKSANQTQLTAGRMRSEYLGGEDLNSL